MRGDVKWDGKELNAIYNAMGVHVSMERIAAYFVVNAVTKNSVNTSMVPV